jgi:predicted RecA/RadA family phage recombinase
MKNYVQNGDYIEFTAGATITSGQLVQVGSLHGVSVTDVANGAKGTLAMEGVFTLPKLTAAAGDACTAGGPVYFSSGSVSGSDSSGTRKLVGYSLAAAAQAVTTVQVRLAN